MINVTAQGFLSGIHIVVLDPKLLTGLLYNGGDLGVMGLDDAREQVMSSLMVEGTSEHCPEPATCSVVLGCGYLQLGPGCLSSELTLFLPK